MITLPKEKRRKIPPILSLGGLEIVIFFGEEKKTEAVYTELGKPKAEGSPSGAWQNGDRALCCSKGQTGPPFQEAEG